MKIFRLFLLIPCFLLPAVFQAMEAPGHPEGPANPFPGVEGKWAHAMLDQLSLEEKIGQLIMVAAYSNKDEAHYQQIDYLVKKMNIGGLIFMQGGPGRQIELVNRYQKQAKIPLLIAQDSEWGINMRLDSTLGFPRNMTLGAITKDSLVYRAGEEIAKECKRVGVQMNFAPAVDVNNNPANPVINDRSFGEEPHRVASKGVEFFQGMKSAGVLACAKHFPGHGDTDSDSHYDLPLIPHNRRRLDSVELVPFRRMIEEGVPSIMVAHLYIPQLDTTKHRASTLSHRIVTGLLREDLGYQGLIITDALNMQGVAKYFPAGEADLEAFLAGNDILLFSGNVSRAVELIKGAVISGKIQESEIDRRVLKILLAKEWAGLNQSKGLTSPIVNQDELGGRRAAILRKNLYEAAITVPLNRNDILPLKQIASRKIACVRIGGNENGEFLKTLVKYAPVQAEALPLVPEKTLRQEVHSKIKNAGLVVVEVHGMNKYVGKDFGISGPAREFVKELKAAGKQVVLVLFGNPYGAKFFGTEDAIVLAYEDDPNANAAAASAIFGGIPWSGKMPVTANSSLRSGMGQDLKNAQRPGLGFPEEAGMDSRVLLRIDTLANEAIRSGSTPGCAVMIMRNGKIVFDKAYGKTEYDAGVKVDPFHTVYDLASVTKISATTLAVMRLVGEGKLKLDESIAAYIPDFRETNKAGILVRNLLLHNTGLQAWIPFHYETFDQNNPKVLSSSYIHNTPDERFCVPITKDLYLCEDFQDSMWLRIVDSNVKEAGKMVYSDLNMIIMGRIIEKITGTTLDKYVDSVFYKPMGLDHTFFNPAKCGQENVCAPTEYDKTWRKTKVQGFVHDQAAAMLGGVSGHAGLFSNVYDLAKLFYMVSHDGMYGGERYLSKEIIDQFTARQVNGNRRGLGWDKPDPANPGGTHASQYASDLTFGHLGFTGICVWVDPKYDLVYVFLSNRTYPNMNNGKLISGGYRGRIMDVAYEAMAAYEGKLKP